MNISNNRMHTDLHAGQQGKVGSTQIAGAIQDWDPRNDKYMMPGFGVLVLHKYALVMHLQDTVLPAMCSTIS